MTEAEALGKAVRAQRELVETREAFDGLRAAITTELFASTTDQSAKREKLYLAMQALNAVQKALESALGGAAVANYQIMLAEQGLTRP